MKRIMTLKTSCVLISYLLGSAGLLFVTTARAECTDSKSASVTCSNAVTKPQVFRTDGQKIHIASGTLFAISGGDNAIFFASRDAMLQNDGSISADADAIRFFSTSNSGILNNGKISSTGFQNHAINVTEVTNGQVENRGTLLTSGDSGNGIYLNTVFNSTITNSSDITTTGVAADGIRAEFISDSTFSNDGMIAVGGNQSNGIYLGSNVKNAKIINSDNGVVYAPDGTGIKITDNASAASLVNKGIIDGGFTGVFFGGTSLTNSFSNSGYIIGSQSADAIVLADNSTVTRFNNQGVIGALTGDAIQVSSGSVIANGIDNNGIIVGRVNAATSYMTNNGIFELLSNQKASVLSAYSQNDTGLLALQADNTSRYGQLKVAGNATLNGRVFVVTRGSSAFSEGDRLSDVVAADSIVGMPSTVLDDSLRYQFVQEKTATSYSLRLVDTNMTTVKNAIASASSNSSLAGIGGAVDTIIVQNNAKTQIQGANCDGALASTVCAITSSFNASQVHNNVVQLAPLMDGNLATIEINRLRAFGDVVSSRQASVRGSGYYDQFNPEKYLWIRQTGSWDSQSNRGDYAGYRADSYGIAMGADGQIYDRARLGLALGISRTDVNDASDDIHHSARINGWNVLAYGGADFTPNIGMTWQTGIGHNNTTGNRSLDIQNPTDQSSAFRGTASSNIDSETFQAGVGLQSTHKPSDEVTITPELRTDYYRVKDKGYQEHGADDLGLKVDSATTESLMVSSKLKTNLQLSEVVSINAYLGAGYDTLNDQTQTRAAFIGSPASSFTYRGMHQSPWITMTGVGITAKFSDVLDGAIQYDADKRTKFISQTIGLKLRYAF